MNVDTFVAAMPGLSRGQAEAYLGPMEVAEREFSITSELRARMWLAQVGHESVSLTYFEEIASGDAYEGRQDLGNTQPGDGRRFKGRGPIQLTGRANYTAAGGALGLDLVGNPAMAAAPQHAFRVSAWWWATHGLNEISDTADVVAATRRINGGLNGLDDRQNRYARCAQLGAAVVPGAGAPGPQPPKPEEIHMVSDTVKTQDNVVHVFQASKGRALWHKWTLNDGADWRNEPLIGPRGAPDYLVKANADSVSAQVIGGWLYVASDDNESGNAWMSRQNTSGGWDIRQLP